MSINYFLRNAARNTQKRTFVRRQWAQYLLFLVFTQRLSQSIWSLLFIVINFFLRNEVWSSQKRVFARRQLSQNLLFFVLLSTSFPIILITIVCCQSIVFSEKKPEVLKSEVSLEDSEHNNCSFFSSFNIFSNRFVKNWGENVMFEEKVTLLSFYCNWEKVFLVFLKKCYKKWFVGFSTSIVDHQCLCRSSIINVRRSRSWLIDRQS